MNPSPKVVIVGAGFAGLKAARWLAREDHFDLTMVDRRNYHLFQPLLYQVATAGLSPADIATPIRSVLSGYKNVHVLLGNVSGVDLNARRVSVGDESLSYDYLILACGAKHSYFNHPEWEANAPGLKTLEQATEIRRRILLAFERAERSQSSDEQCQYLTFVIVGGGPTGVELAGAIGEIARHTLGKDFHNIHPERARVILIEAGPRILGAFREDLSQRAASDLKDLGVEIRTNCRVTEVSETGVRIGEEKILARTAIWAAGVQPSSLSRTLGVELDALGRVKVQTDLSLVDHPEVFVLGDQAHFATADGKGLPGLAPVAMQQGAWAAENIIRDQKKKPRRPFVYRDKGMMATIGRKRAVVQTAHSHFGGWLAWLAWLFVHIYYLIGFKNRFFVFLQWSWSYVTFKRGARLILDKEWRSVPRP